jgi:hypothetical protein
MVRHQNLPQKWQGQEEHEFEGFVVPEVMVGWENGWLVVGTRGWTGGGGPSM